MRAWLLAGAAALTATGAAAGAAPVVMTDILPVQSIVAAVMQGVGTPGVLLPPGADPHAYALRPSDAQALADADLVVWVGPDLTHWLADPLDALAPGAVKLALEQAPDVETLPVRADGPFEPDEHDHDSDEDHAQGHDHDSGAARDGHLWLDPANAAAAARDVAATLARLDPANAAAYSANADRFATDMTALASEVTAEVAPLRGKPFLVFHDAYQYFEHAFGLPAAGSVALQDGVEPGPARIAAIRAKVADGGIACAFTEPEFSPKLMATITEGTSVGSGTLDHLGAKLDPGPTLYPALIRGLAADFAACLNGKS
ncbi:MAG: zinc ABC transporter substrate-binding protein [Amaricoccus sp.]|uniref:zinc ABC transporter substrate-binding protein n=1 Tax=Amaricoccus sp. TaxID=1872485 RepID=UPI0039E66235